jgi:hypothetical protein
VLSWRYDVDDVLGVLAAPRCAYALKKAAKVFNGDRLARFETPNVYYEATINERQACEGHPVAVVGGGNSAGQASPSGVTFAVGALLSTSAILTFLVGVLALAAYELVVAGPGYEYTFQMTAWGWVNILTGLALAGVAVAVIVNPAQARFAAVIATFLAVVVSFLLMPYYRRARLS